MPENELIIYEIQEIDLTLFKEPDYNDRKNKTQDTLLSDRYWHKMKKVGIIPDIVVNLRTNNIVSGSWRCQRLLSEGITRIKAIVIDVDLSREKELNDMLNTHVRGFDTTQRRNKLKDIKDLSYLDRRERFILKPSDRSISLPKSMDTLKTKPMNLSMPTINLNSIPQEVSKVKNEKSYEELLEEQEREREYSQAGKPLLIVMYEKDWELLEEVKALMNVKGDKNAIIKALQGYKRLFNASNQFIR